MGAKDLCDLDCQMAEPANTEHSHSLALLDAGVPDGTVDGHAGAEHGRRFLGAESLGHASRMAGFGFDELRISSIDAHPGDHLGQAEVLAPLEAMLAHAACPVNPRHSHAIALLQVSYCA